MTIAVTGSDGQLGWEICRQLPRETTGLTRTECDLTNPSRMVRCLRSLQPAAIVNCAAYTQVDGAESDAETCFQINATAVEWLAEFCQEWNCPLVQISTDFVFGEMGRPGPFCEEDRPHPQGVYARSKLAGEQLAMQIPQHLVIRTCGLYGSAPGRANFVRTMLRLGAERSEVRVVDDQICTPSYVPHVAAALLYLLQTKTWGLFHVANGGSTSWCDFAREIFLQAGVSTHVRPISTAEFGAAAPRPANSVLSTAKYDRLGGPQLPDWKEALAEYLTSSG